MATIQTIGTNSRDFSTLQAWEDAIPSTPTGGYEGHCYNDSEFTANVNISGHTTSGANYIRLTAAAGQSFADHASKRTNPLFYDQSKGVGIHSNPGAVHVIEIGDSNVTIDRIQVRRSVASYSFSCIRVSANGLNPVVKDCIVAKDFSANVVALSVGVGKAINCLVYNTGSTPGDGILIWELYGAHGSAINCTVVNAGGAGGIGIDSDGLSNSNNPINNCAVFGYASASGGSPTGNRNATNLASGLPGANSVFNLTASNQFVNASNDFRLKAGSALIAAGNTDATNAPNDITGVARGVGTAGDIGAWEADTSSGSLISRDRNVSGGMRDMTGGMT